ncbi:hypothetical protein MUK42_23521 [Musa troglodytarum]|uniref:Uncharacterized protein n=1 Tax=Musa troglodytarum TaxID=320322 RepID=A0A9E7GBT9_9LILI|nr:hypothetical protein MUK42_23521 [Musa troglodytarum]
MQGEEEDVSSDCSNGCQSGWTDYLGQSSEEREDDLSMVSDASTGPPHFGNRTSIPAVIFFPALAFRVAVASALPRLRLLDWPRAVPRRRESN